MLGLTKENWRHVALLVRQGRNPAPVVYDSLGPNFPLAFSPGWLNLGLWESDGEVDEAPIAVRRLVERVAAVLPSGGVILDVGNGLGAQDPVIAAVARPRQLIVVNITESQLRAGRALLSEAGAVPVLADATTLPIADGSFDGIISVEAAFHFSSRAAFFAECRRVLRPGGVLTMSDVSVERLPSRLGEVFSGLIGLRIWGLRSHSMVPAQEIVATARDAGLSDVHVERVGDRVIDPAFTFARRRLDADGGMPRWQRRVGRALVGAWSKLRAKGMVEYILLTATAA
ncbi:MAG: methyltransferase domain-containing protein [Actinomycetota bacterium]|nr:methyltransferase domain-containing protein [Actinomycetota bacterium]